MSRVRIVFMGTPEFAVPSLAQLLRDEHFEVVGVVTQPDRPAGRGMKMMPSPVRVLAGQHGLPVLTPTRVGDPTVIEEIRRLGGELGVVVAFGQILPDAVLGLFPLGCMNVHASLLPKWRGAAPIQRSLMAGDGETGVCLQKMVRKLDAGDVIGARKVPLSDEINARELHDQLKMLGADLLHVELMDYFRGNLTGTVQDETKATYASKILKNEAQIEWQRSARELHNLVRGLAMGPVAHAQRENRKVKFWRTQIMSEGKSSRGKPGQLVEITPSGFVFACGSGELEVLELQMEAKSRQSARQFRVGYPLHVGEQWT